MVAVTGGSTCTCREESTKQPGAAHVPERRSCTATREGSRARGRLPRDAAQGTHLRPGRRPQRPRLRPSSGPCAPGSGDAAGTRPEGPGMPAAAHSGPGRVPRGQRRSTRLRGGCRAGVPMATGRAASRASWRWGLRGRSGRRGRGWSPTPGSPIAPPGARSPPVSTPRGPRGPTWGWGASMAVPPALSSANRTPGRKSKRERERTLSSPPGFQKFPETACFHIPPKRGANASPFLTRFLSLLACCSQARSCRKVAKIRNQAALEQSEKSGLSGPRGASALKSWAQSSAATLLI